MKAFWSDMFFDLQQGNETEEGSAKQSGEFIRDDFDQIERAIKDFDLKKALILIEEAKDNY